MPLESRVRVELQATERNALDLVAATAPLQVERNLILRNGTGAGNANILWSDQRTIAASGTDDLDLNGTTLKTAFNADVAMARVKGIYIAAASTNTNNVVVGGAASNQFATWVGAATHTVVVRPGGFIMLGTGQADATCYAVTAATGDILRVANSGAGTPVTYDIVLLGCSA